MYSRLWSENCKHFSNLGVLVKKSECSYHSDHLISLRYLHSVMSNKGFSTLL